jgi:hypothetical protein
MPPVQYINISVFSLSTPFRGSEGSICTTAKVERDIKNWILEYISWIKGCTSRQGDETS